MKVLSTARRKMEESVRKKVTANAVIQSLQNALFVTFDTNHERKLVQRLDEFSADGHTLNLQQVRRRVTTDEVVKFVREEVRKEYKARHQGRAVSSAGRQVAHIEGCCCDDARPPDSEGPATGSVPTAGAKGLYTNEEVAVYAFVAHNLSNQGRHRSKWQPVNRKQRKETRRVGSPPLTFKECITKYHKGCFVCYGRNQAHDHHHKTCKRR